MRKSTFGVAAAGALFLAACWIFGGSRASDPLPDRAPRRRSPEPVRAEAAPPERVARSPDTAPETAAAEAGEVDDASSDSPISEEEVESERSLWEAIGRMLEERELVGWVECRRRIVDATIAYFGLGAGDGAALRSLTEAATAEVGFAEAAREAAAQALPESLEDGPRELLASQVEEQYQAQLERARGGLEVLLGRDEKGRRFVSGRLEEWLAALGRPR